MHDSRRIAVAWPSPIQAIGLVFFWYLFFKHEPIISLQLKIISQGNKGTMSRSLPADVLWVRLYVMRILLF